MFENALFMDKIERFKKIGYKTAFCFQDVL